MDDSSDGTVAVSVIGLELPVSAQEIKAKKRRATDSQVTSFRAATPMRDLLDPQVLLEPSSSSGSDPNSGSSDPSTGDDTSPSSFLGTPYSTTLQFDYPFPISNAPREPGFPQALPPSALPIANSIGSAPSMVTAAASVAADSPDQTTSSPLPSLVSTIAACMEVPVNTTLSDLRNLSNKSTSSLGSTHSAQTAPSMVPVASSAASVHSVSPSSSFHSYSQNHSSQPGNTTSPAGRQKARHSLVISPLPPPSLSIHTNIPKPATSPPNPLKRPKFSKAPSNASDVSHESNASMSRPRPTSGSLSSLSIASIQFLSNPGEPPVPPSLLNKLNRPRHQPSLSTNANSYFSPVSATQKTLNSRDFFGSPYDSTVVSAPASPPTTLNTDSSVSEFFKPISPPATKTGFSVFRPQLGRSNSTNGPNPPSSSASSLSRPFFGRSNTTNSQLQSRAYAQHLRHQQQQQLKQEAQRKKEESKRKAEKERKEKKGRRGSLSLSRSASGSSISSVPSRNSSSTKSKSPSSSNSVADGFKLSPTQSSLVENAISESEGSASPEGTKVRRRSSVRRILEKTGSLVGFNLSLDKARYGHGNGNTSPKEGKKSPKQRSGKSSPRDGSTKSPNRSGHVSPKSSDTN